MRIPIQSLGFAYKKNKKLEHRNGRSGGKIVHLSPPKHPPFPVSYVLFRPPAEARSPSSSSLGKTHQELCFRSTHFALLPLLLSLRYLSMSFLIFLVNFFIRDFFFWINVGEICNLCFWLTRRRVGEPAGLGVRCDPRLGCGGACCCG